MGSRAVSSHTHIAAENDFRQGSHRETVLVTGKSGDPLSFSSRNSTEHIEGGQKPVTYLLLCTGDREGLWGI